MVVLLSLKFLLLENCPHLLFDQVNLVLDTIPLDRLVEPQHDINDVLVQDLLEGLGDEYNVNVLVDTFNILEGFHSFLGGDQILNDQV